ncbi:MAG: hypothetical protein ACRECX_09045 [Methyloceanibacter sp.]|uniref:hypothetical protein n=1 Tax=Methyloceanibacter sp. TaxID=1965321 RepID=UPI003D6D6C29
MRRMAVGLAALLAVAFCGAASGESVQDEIQDAEQPGSEIEIDLGGGKPQIHREGGGPIFGEGEAEVPLEPLDDPDNPIDPDPIDEELPGEGPEDLSGPFDEDPLPE